VFNGYPLNSRQGEMLPPLTPLNLFKFDRYGGEAECRLCVLGLYCLPLIGMNIMNAV